MSEYGSQSRVACIGPAGEKLSLIAGILTDHGSLAARSGLGAVMGAKKLKAVVCRGNMEVPVFDKAAADKSRSDQLDMWKKMPGPIPGTDLDVMRNTAPAGLFIWPRTVVTVRLKIGAGLALLTYRTSRACTRMFLPPVWKKDMPAGIVQKVCKAVLKAGEGEYKYAAGVHRPEYETVAAFGVNCANSNTDSISMANDICNRAGLDTISAGTVIAFAIELYEKGILTINDTDGIDLNGETTRLCGDDR